MKIVRHGLSVGIARIGASDFSLDIKASGKLTHEDYEIINPLVDSAMEAVKDAKVKVLFDAMELEGWDLRAAWDDFKFGLKHNNEFEKIAIYGNKEWLEKSAKVASWFMSGEIKYFDNLGDAFEWLHG